MATIDPMRRFSMPRSAARAVKKAPSRFVRSTSLQSSELIRSASPSRVMPALRTTALRSPIDSAASTNARAEASSATST